MKNVIIWKSLTDIRDEYIKEAAPDRENAANELKTQNKRLQKKRIAWGALAASLVITVIAASPLIGRLLSSDPNTEVADDAYANYPTRPMRAYENSEPQASVFFAFEYEVNGVIERLGYPSIEWGGENYRLTSSKYNYVTVSDEQIGEKLDEFAVNAYAHGWGKEKHATLNATLYTCEGIDPAYGVVVTLEGVKNAYLYRSGKYADSLDELVEKVNYRELLTVSSNIFHSTRNSKGEAVELVFEGMTADILWNELLSQGETVDYDGDDDYYLRVSIGHELLQYNSTLCISADGYITFGALKAGKAVYVGKERVRAFLDYLEDNLTGYRLVEEVEPSPEANGNDDPSVVTTAASAYNPNASE